MNGRKRLNLWLAGYGYTVEKHHPVALRHNAAFVPETDFLIEHELLRRGADFTFVQIGANDGISRKDDLFHFIRHYPMSGVMVEPQRDMFPKLQANLAAYPNIRLVNKAIHATATSFTLYKMRPEAVDPNAKLPIWARTNGIASFDREHVLRHVRQIGLGDEVITEETVPCTTLAQLLREEGISRVDLLKVDTEGYDHEILKTLDLTAARPTIIRFEHAHVPAPELEALLERLVAAGYRLLCDKNNTTAYLPTPLAV